LVHVREAENGKALALGARGDNVFPHLSDRLTVRYARDPYLDNRVDVFYRIFSGHAKSVDAQVRFFL
jgi:hypothetical protein